MSSLKRSSLQRRPLLSSCFVVATAGLVFLLANSSSTQAQVIQQQVGGVTIDPQGIVNRVDLDVLNQLKRAREQALQPLAGELKEKSLRKISLRQLEAAIDSHRKQGVPLSDEMRYLAGMQRIQYVFVYPEHNDIVLAGPGEGWKIDAQGEVVGITTNQPVMLLDDLLVALRAVRAEQPSVLSCSIDPTTAGLTRMQALLKRTRTVGDDPEGLMREIEQTLGPQTITLGGVPETSHFAGVMVSADYRMKRLAMGFEPAPIAGLPSFMEMLRTSSRPSKLMMPRWWMAPNYEALLADPESLAWEIRGAGVKAMTEDEVLSAGGQRQRTGQSNPLAKKWADNFTANYESLSKRDAVFGQLRNCMDLAVVAALIAKERLTEKCSWSMPLLLDPDLAVETFNAPHQLASVASATQKGSTWIISASGGVQVNPWAMVDKPQPSATLSAERAKTTLPAGRWWWN